MSLLWSIPVAFMAVFAVLAYLRRPGRKVLPVSRLVQAKRRFHVEREWLEAKFVQLAAAAGVKSDAPHWTDCTFADDVSYVRSRATGELSAFVAVTVATEDLDGSPSGSADVVGNLQAGTAVFRFDRDHWVTDGRAILNLTPGEAAHYYRSDLEIVGEELAHRS